MRAAGLAALAGLIAAAPGAALAHDPLGLGVPVLAGAANPIAHPLQGIALAALAAVAAAQRRAGVPLRAGVLLCLAAGAGPLLLLVTRWGPAPWGPTPALIALAAGLAAAGPPRWAAETLAPPLGVAALALGLSTDLHPPFAVAAEMALGAALGLPAVALLVIAALRAVPEPTRRLAAGVVGAWSAAAGAMGLVFLYAV